MKTKTVLCVAEQKETEHLVSTAPNDEVLLTCPCGTFLKFPQNIDSKQLDRLIKLHNLANKDQVLAE